MTDSLSIAGKWSRGLWRAEPQDIFGDINIVLADDSEDSRAIAAVISNLRPDHEIIANGDLIAAAPELYEALAEAETILTRLDTLGANFPALEAARAALAKARGSL